MFKFIREYFGFFYLLFFFGFLSIYLVPWLTPVINSAILISSYLIIINRRRFDIVIALILYSKCLSGFIIYHNKLAYDVVNVMVNLIPTLLYFGSVLMLRKKEIIQRLKNDEFYNAHRFTLIFFLMLTVSFIINFSTSYDLLTKRYLPFALFVVFILLYAGKTYFNVFGLIRFFRATFLASLILYFLPLYLGITKGLIESDSVFSVSSASNSYSLIYFNLIRNLGFTWDHRILAILAYLYLLLVLLFKPKYFKLDIFLSAFIVVSTTSRGGIVTYSVILLAYLFQLYRGKLVTIMLSIGFLTLVSFYLMMNVLSMPTLKFIESFSPKSEYNAFNQRKVFANYALDAFYKKPVLGNGVGYLSSHTIKRNLVVNGARIPAAGDAFWYILLAEMGIIGLILYFLFLAEVFYSTNILNIAFLSGFVLQLLGTDIPDMRFSYFAILVIALIANNRMKSNAMKRLNLKYEN